MQHSYPTLALPPLSLFFWLLLAACTRPTTPPPILGEDQHTENLDKSKILEFLLEGNTRFSEEHPIHPDQTLEKLRALNQGQHPIAAIVSCSDSRVPPELLFDQGLGDLFVIRNAGNIVSDYEIGSVEYAIDHLEVPLVIVLGHTQCGAIGAYVAKVQDTSSHLGTQAHPTYSTYIEKIIAYIEAEDEEKALPKSAPNFYEQAIVANVMHGVQAIHDALPEVEDKIKRGKLRIIGAIYDMETGKVRTLEKKL